MTSPFGNPADRAAQQPDIDPTETEEWLESLDQVVANRGTHRAAYLLSQLTDRARRLAVEVSDSITTPYVNTIPPDQTPPYPGDLVMEKRIRRFIRWNAAVMVIKANHRIKGLGGHLSTFASSALLYEVGFNHFFRGKDPDGTGDAVYFQGHAAPGIYARAFLEGRLDESDLDNFRTEIGGGGLSSYPHPRLMPDFWEYPTVSMGLGPINSIYHARYLRYLHNRGIDDTSASRVWCFIGDGETDEPETLGSISLAARERLDNLVWVINCNLQRLDGPVRGNGKIIQELESLFRGAGWNVLKVIWGSNWDPLLAADRTGALVEIMDGTVDGEYQRYKAENGAFVRKEFFGKHPDALALVEHMTDDQIWGLRRGGHDPVKVHAAYAAAVAHTGRPTVILAKTIKGWALGPDVEGRNATHQIKQLTNQQLMELRTRLHLEQEIPESALADDADPPYYRPAPGSPEHTYLMDRRTRLGGPLPSRTRQVRRPLPPSPVTTAFSETYAGSGQAEASTTTAFTRLLRNLTRVEGFGERVVPIVPDEARTFGMDSLFREIKIYSSQGQRYEPVDAKMLLAYVEGQDGQILEEGITEAGGTASWLSAATSYATRGVPMVPFYIFYSMFGFQRVGDLLWAASDAGARGFLLGATAGRTTLQGEGLQHQDGHSLLLSSVIPACQVYDPAFAYEMGVIIEDGLRRMYQDDENVYYYLTLYNENYPQPPKPEGIDQGIIDGIYRWAEAPAGVHARATILFSGSANLAARQAQADLAEHYGVGAELWSVTSYKRLREEAMTVDRWNRLHPDQAERTPLVTRVLEPAPGPIVAISDFIRAVPDQIGRWVRAPYTVLGTDGYGRSDGRDALRRFFEVDTGHVVAATLASLVRRSQISPRALDDAFRRHGIDPETSPSWER